MGISLLVVSQCNLPFIWWRQKSMDACTSFTTSHFRSRHIKKKEFCFNTWLTLASCASTLQIKSLLLCLNSVSASFGGNIWRPITSLRHTKAVPIPRLLQLQPSFPCFWRTIEHGYYPSWPHISQDYLRARKRRKRERKWQHCMA